jgi:hypothetical protein
MLRIPAFTLTAILLLPACGNLSAKTGPNASAAGSNLVGSASGGVANSISGFYPNAGTYTSVPSQIQINFNSASIDAVAGSSVTTYTMSCGGNPLAAQSVTFTSGLQNVTVALPSITGLADGTTCSFNVSLNLRDSSGNFITGSHTVSYIISASGATLSGSGSTWNEQSTSSLTASVGSAIGSNFQGVGAAGVVLDGLLLNGTTSINGISGLWTHGFSSSTTSAGPVQGSSSGGFGQVTCPSGMRMTGVTGTAGSFINSIAIICKSQDQSQTWTSGSAGQASGASFTLSCPAGLFATDLDGMSDQYLEELYLGCR